MGFEAGRAQCCGLLLHTLAQDVCQRDRTTRFGDGLGERQTQPACGACDEHLAAGQQPGSRIALRHVGLPKQWA